MNEADYIRYQSPTPDSLHGIHAALSVDEATIISVPDAVLAGWKFVDQVLELPSPTPPPVEVSDQVPVFRDCSWKEPETPSEPPPPAPQLYTTTTTSFSDTALVRVQQALLRMCAARGDLFAVLSVPAEYRENELLTHAGKLTETATLSYGGLYHPWLTGREEDSLDHCGPRRRRARSQAPWPSGRCCAGGLDRSGRRGAARRGGCWSRRCAGRTGRRCRTRRSTSSGRSPRDSSASTRTRLEPGRRLRPINVRRLLAAAASSGAPAGRELRLRTQRCAFPPQRAARLRGDARRHVSARRVRWSHGG